MKRWRVVQQVQQKGVWLWRVGALLCLLWIGAGQARPVVAETLAPNSDDEIVYFDTNNVIRIYDPTPSSTVLQVEWFSPEGGWGDMALGDVSGDGDMEIVAIRQDGNGGRLTIFDPVAQDSPPDQTQSIGGVPWAILYDLSLPRPPRLVAVGEFDTSNSQREILYSYAVDDDTDRFVILHSSGEGLPGRGWEEQLTFELEGHWTAVATGNMVVADAIDEVALVSFERGELGIFRVVPAIERIFTNVNLEHRWTNVAFGNFLDADTTVAGKELGAVRDADVPIASTWVFRYNGTSVVDGFFDRLSPSPNVVFFAKITSNVDEELVVLRQVRPELGPRARLIVRDGGGNDVLKLSEELLDGDNQYRGGDAGDVDGDGLDEIVVMRDNRLRIYTEPNLSINYTLIERFTNGHTIELGNLDAAGLASTPILFASLTSVSAVLEPEQSSGGTTLINLLDSAKGTSMPFTLNIEGAADWVNVQQSGSVTPATLTVSFDARTVQPGQYSGRIVVDVQSAGVQNDPVVIDLALTVESVVSASPESVNFVYFPCEEPLDARDQTVSLSAQSAMTYTAQIEGNPAWLTVAPESGVLPEDVIVSIDPALRPADIAEADLLVTVDLPTRAGVVNRVPIFLACPTYRLYVPSVTN